jgi:hypothetical protein
MFSDVVMLFETACRPPYWNDVFYSGFGFNVKGDLFVRVTNLTVAMRRFL